MQAACQFVEYIEETYAGTMWLGVASRNAQVLKPSQRGLSHSEAAALMQGGAQQGGVVCYDDLDQDFICTSKELAHV